ncbi:MAG: DNA translocase FtsK [Gammaproteobacteria bacterium]
MKQATRKSTENHQSHFSKRLREGLLIVLGSFALFILLSLITYHNSDPGWSSTGQGDVIANAGGKAGAWIADLVLYIFGYVAYLFPFLLGYSAWVILFVNQREQQSFESKSLVLRSFGFILFLVGACGLATLQFGEFHAHLPYTAGGIAGDLVGPILVNNFNILGSTLVLMTFVTVGITLLSGLSWLKLFDYIGQMSLKVIKLGLKFLAKLNPIAWFKQRRAMKVTSVVEPKIYSRTEPAVDEEIFEEPVALRKKLITPPVQKPVVKPITSKTKVKNSITKSSNGLPSIDLLDPAEHTFERGYTPAQLESMSREVEMRLRDFGIDVQVVAVHPGPVITRFEMQLAPGLKVSRISSLVKDLARSLSVVSVRIVEVIPGKSVVGLELPNETRQIVRLSEILASSQYEQLKSPMALALGKDISGHPVIVDLAKMPHLLVAGTTGSGKSVGVNAMLVGLLYKASPEELRMILVDPKMLELSVYQGIPHLLTPVVTDMKEAANALRWCVAEMERRYRMMASLGVRNLAGYNVKVKDAEKNGTPLYDPLWQGEDEERPTLKTLPFIVVVIDEFADMMMVVGKKVEQLIARIAQKARAAGIHLILATQRPSVDVITGLIKANIPTRIAFQVSSKIDSRTILDQGGAEQLLGNGDMLYLPPGTSVPVRVHGAFVADHEVHQVVADWQSRGSPEYINEITVDPNEEGAEGASTSSSNEESDPLYDEAVFVVTRSRRATISSLQRRLKIGYNRAARMNEDMETAGIVGPMESNGVREVLAPEPVE